MASAQVASALLREDDELLPGETINALNNTAVNHVGGYACSLSTTGTGTISRIWGNASGGPGMLLRSEGTFGVFEQTSYESFYGMSDDGLLGYGTTSTNIDSGDTGLDGVWIDDMPVLHELDPVPSLPGQFSSFNSRPGMTGDGTIVWVGGFTDSQGGSTQNRALFSGVGAASLLMGGDFLPGIPEPVETGASNIDFDWRVSRFGTNWIDLVLVDTSSADDGVMVISGTPIMAGGGIMREDSPVPAAVGGMPGELWDNFDFLGINDAGDYMVTGDTDADTDFDEFVLLNGEIILREGDMLDHGGMPATVSGSIEGGYMNDSLDWAVIWDVDDAGGSNIEALIFNGEILLVEGDPVDWNGDGIVDAGDNGGILDNFTGISTLTVGARVGGVVNIYFTADVTFDGDELEGFFCLPVQVGIPAVEAAVDVKPGGCPNPLNRVSNGVLPVVVAGSDMIDVLDVDLATVELFRGDGAGGSVAPNIGPPGPGVSYVDLTSSTLGEPCECDGGGIDGITDLSLKFLTDELVAALELEDLAQGTNVELCVGGLMLDGTPFVGCDCAWLVPPGSPDGMIAVSSNLPDVWIDAGPLDGFLDGGGLTSFNRFHDPGTVVTLQAPLSPALHPDWTLAGWWINGVLHPELGATVTVEVEGIGTTAAPRYVAPTPGQFQRPAFPGGLNR